MRYILYSFSHFHFKDFNKKTQSLETYFTILAAIEDNLVEFHQIKEQLIQIVQDIKALANADELSDDDIFEFSTMATGGRHTTYIHRQSCVAFTGSNLRFQKSRNLFETH